MPRAEKRGAFNIDNYYSSTSPIANQFIPQFGFLPDSPLVNNQEAVVLPLLTVCSAYSSRVCPYVQ